MAYATLAQVKASLGINSTDGADDTLLTAALTAAEDMIDGHTGRTFGTAGSATRAYTTTVPDLVFIDDAITITSVVTDTGLDGTWATTWATTDWQAEPLNGLSQGRAWPYTRIRAIDDYLFPVARRATVRVTGTWGWSAVPAPVTEATIRQAARLFKRNDAPLGVAGFGDMGAVRVSRYLDPDVELLLQPYRVGTSAIGGIA